MLTRMARLSLTAPRRVIAVVILVMVGTAIFGIPAANSLAAGGFLDPSAESARAAAVLADKFHRGDMEMVLLVSSDDGVRDGPARIVGTDIARQLAQSPFVAQVASPWDTPQPPPDMVSADGKSALILVALKGDENSAPRHAQALAQRLAHNRGGVTVQAGGSAMVYAQVNQQTEKDLLRMEFIAVPVSFAALVWVFGGLLAAALPVAVGGFAILGSLAVLRGVAMVTDVSIFALNVTVALGMALAIDYTLLIISRYRDELGEGRSHEEALVRTMSTAGRTVLFSAVTVGLSLVAMALFPMYFLKSFAYAGVAVVAFSALAAMVVAPTVIVLLGDRLDALNVWKLGRRLLGRPEPPPRPVAQSFWYRTAKLVTRHAIPVGLAIIVLLIALGIPFLNIKWGYPDDRVLPPSASARMVSDRIRSDFSSNSASRVTVVLTDTAGLTKPDLNHYAAQLSEVSDVSAVSAPTGTFVAGELRGPPSAPTAMAAGSAYLTVESTAPLYTKASANQLDRLHAVALPGDTAVQMTGVAQMNRDSVNGITSRLPMVFGFIAIVTLVLLFLLTGSVLLPIKAVVLNMLSLTAAFGALVWIFQDGHLGALGTTPTGTLVANIPVLMFCIAFGLSMDYEVFLLSRIREFWLASPRESADNDESIALGLAHTGRVITAAALLMSISFAGLISAEVSFMRMFGVGLTIAVLVDATLVRVLLVPAFMHVFGGLNWWAPKPLERWHSRSAGGGSAGQTARSNDAVGGNSSKFDSNRRVDDHVHRSRR
ncbi:Membrane protein YdfJ [Mycobacterium marinum]|uniref:MMPL family transporter n=1 Tax=Mycobacterium marinum TaxID=1781 RepID=UPI00045FEAC1|nr:MMPL family transporter [Mycobacterium marinum]AXN46737.1 Membrane protein YdfJ [Mycobacterium marinum]RFZ10512.1 Membrane protein YdfJ [Mycobacterium marinum]RFZ11346.1 Membrane protein YdfJ [Mycobacterium marinum]RFZ14352.1 Membrane protein YdfJ [Mycobacterium marinum]RFZ44987.1 Membrane protein YdfJ [Mycobacterium marinum]